MTEHASTALGPKAGAVPEDEAPHNGPLLLATLGVVYGDIGTSPLYTLREIFVQGRIAPQPEAVLGALSLIFWTIFMVATVKYVVFVLRADNKGEGGILALSALVTRRRKPGPRSVMLLTFGLIGAALFYGDGVITPAISVLSAVEGLQVAAPSLDRWVVPLSLVILVLLFAVQRYGTASVGRLFGPVTLVWFLAIGILGAVQIAQRPEVLMAIGPQYAIGFLFGQGWHGFALLGATVLCVTGAEALYADMGHFGRWPIRVAWFALVWPMLLLNYFGQGALLLEDMSAIENPFYRLAPSWGLYPLVLLATMATVIASQAVISGAFSLTHQAVRLGYLPRLQVCHTSEEEIGQVYVPVVNWLMLVSIIGLVVGFESSSALAGAYGIAVTGTMVVTTVLGFEVARRYGRLRLRYAIPLAVTFLVIDVAFLGANLMKLLEGGWFPLLVGLLVWVVMSTWIRGRKALFEKRLRDALPIPSLLERAAKTPVRSARTAVYMTGDLAAVPASLLHNLKHNMVLHERVILMKVQPVEEPHVPDAERLEVTPLGKGFHTVLYRHGFKEDPDVPAALAACRRFGLVVDPMATSYFLSRETLVASDSPALPGWREPLFITLHAIAGDATRFFKLPPGQVVELGAQVEI